MSEILKNEQGREGFETEDLSPAGVFYFLAGLAVVCVLIYFIVVGMYRFLDAYDRSHQAALNPMAVKTGVEPRTMMTEEITWYIRRLQGGWGSIGVFLVLFHFAVPFVLLLSRPFKRDIRKLAWLAAWMLFMRYVDLFWIIEPNFSATLRVTLADLVIPFAMGGLWIAYFCRNLNSMPLLPAYDVYAKQVLEPAHE